MYRKKLVTFEEGIRSLQQTSDFATLRELINEMLYICPPAKGHLAKDSIARTMRRKQAYEIQQSQGYPDALAAIDRKYKDLAIVLRHANSNGMQLGSGGFGELPPNTAQAAMPPTPQPAPQAPRSAAIAKPKLSPMMGLKPLILLNWAKSKKDTIIKGAALATVAGGAYFIFQKYVTDNKKKKNPKEKETDFDRTIRSIQKYRAFSKMSNDTDIGSEYLDKLDGKKKKKKKSSAKEANRLDDWERQEETLMRSMNATHRALAEKPKTHFSLPKLPDPKKNPIPVISDSVDTTTHSQAKKRRKKKSSKKAIDSAAEDSDSFEEEIVTTKRRKRKNPAGKKETGRLIPIVKRTKRVRKIS